MVADFGSRGLHRWMESAGWALLSGRNVQDAVLSPDGTAVVADFGADGLRVYTTGWAVLLGLDPEEIMVG